MRGFEAGSGQRLSDPIGEVGIEVATTQIGEHAGTAVRIVRVDVTNGADCICRVGPPSETGQGDGLHDITMCDVRSMNLPGGCEGLIEASADEMVK